MGRQQEMKFSFRRAANETKGDAEKNLTLSVAQYGDVMARYDTIDGDRRIAGVYESIHDNDTVLLPSSRHIRPAMDLVVVA
ncbi:uncharacterized protein N7482_004581 [Penicillium canariense]|uniref:Uncharacterized protein n=1 Tax=Penicillium canariense TaxID=189055 RepID=A0A9W9LPP7_9EURO|nr:uncharacterized protein N7482_004581 [Penicillium canariense]KAJ5168987.1 hypothetical protein N7482_004581 [Penicillium canariense]